MNFLKYAAAAGLVALGPLHVTGTHADNTGLPVGQILHVDSLSDLEDVRLAQVASGDAVFLEGPAGRAGLFQWDDSDLSALVTVDTEQCVLVAPATDTDGSSGAWRRVDHGPIDIQWCGAISDDGSDDTDAVQGAINVASVLVEQITASWDLVANAVYIPAGDYEFTDITAVQSTDGLTISGAGMGASMLSYQGTGTAITIGTLTGNPFFSHFWLRDLSIRGEPNGNTANIIANTVGLHVARTIRKSGMERVQIFGFERNVFLDQVWTFSIASCHIHRATKRLIYWTSANVGQILYSRIDDSEESLVEINGENNILTHNILIQGNSFQEATRSAILLIDIDNATLIENYFENNNQSNGGHHTVRMIEGSGAYGWGQLTSIGNYFSPAGSTWTGTEYAYFIDNAVKSFWSIGDRMGSSAYNALVRAEAGVNRVDVHSGVFVNTATAVSVADATLTRVRQDWVTVDGTGAVTKSVDSLGSIGSGIGSSGSNITSSASAAFYLATSSGNQAFTLDDDQRVDGHTVFIRKTVGTGTLTIAPETTTTTRINNDGSAVTSMAVTTISTVILTYSASGDDWVVMQK